MQKQANAIVLTAQGVPFIHAGAEFMRSKPTSNGYDGNSYESPDSVNQLRWDLKVEHLDVFNYYKGLIALRKTHPAFRLETAAEVIDKLSFLYEDETNIIAYQIDNMDWSIEGENGVKFSSSTTAVNSKNLNFRKWTENGYWLETALKLAKKLLRPIKAVPVLTYWNMKL